MSQALLLAEAEPGTQEFLERHLASDGFEVLRAAAEELALDLAERVRPDLVLAGGLEDASGPDVCRRLREGEPGRTWDRDVPVIVLGEARSDASRGRSTTRSWSPGSTRSCGARGRPSASAWRPGRSRSTAPRAE